MMKKILMPAMMMLTTLAILPSNKTIIANADTKNVENGYISTNLVNSNGYVNVVDKKEDIEANFVNRLGDFQVVDWNTLWMRELFAKNTPKDETTKFCKYNDTDEFNKFSIGNKKVDFIAEIEAGRYYSLVYEKISVNTLFDDWDKEKEQPLELVYNLVHSDLNDHDTYLFYSLFDDYEIQDFSIPLLKIDGESIVELVKENDSISIKRCNSRVYPGLYEGNYPEQYFTNYNGDFFVEIPFKNYIQTIEMYQFRVWYDNDISKNVPITWLLNDNFYLYKLAADNSIFSPFNFSNIDLKSGLITAVAADRATKIDTAFGYISDHYNLDYIIINNDTLVYTQPTGNYYLDNGREQEYKMCLDNTFKTPFNYDCDNEFINKLKSSNDDIDFNITYFSYSLVFDNTDLRENLRDILDDTLRPGGYTKPSISEKDLKDKIGIAPSPIIKQPKSLRRATSSSQVSNAVVDCGQYYAFRYNCNFKIHSVSYAAVQTHDFGSSRLFFGISDDSVNTNIRYLNGVMFTYAYKKGKNKNTEYSLSFVTGDLPIDGRNFAIFGHSSDDVVKKKDKFETEFKLRSGSAWEYTGLFITGRLGDLGSYNDGFVISTKENVKYKELLSFIYVNQTGDIVNLSLLKDGRGEGYTAVIDDDGKVTIIDINGNKHPGYHFDEETGVLKDELGRQVHGGDVKDDDNNWWKKLLATILTVLIITGTVCLVSKVGPTLAIVFTNRNKKKKRRK